MSNANPSMHHVGLCWGSYLMEQLAIPLSNQKTIAKWLVITPAYVLSHPLVFLQQRFQIGERIMRRHGLIFAFPVPHGFIQLARVFVVVAIQA